MKFENQGGNSRSTIYSLYDYSQNPYGETILSLEYCYDTGEWWFLHQSVHMTHEHMEALSNLLIKLISERQEKSR